MKTKTIITIILAILVYNANAQDINSLPHFNYGSDTIIYVYISPEPLYLPWGGYGIDITEGNGTNDRWYGKPNTDAIVSQLGYNGGDAYPALVCDTLTAFGFNDWYLPAHEECSYIKGYYNYEYDWGMPLIDTIEISIWSSNEYPPWPDIRASYWLLYYTQEVCSYPEDKNQSKDFTCIRREYISNNNIQVANNVFSINYINNSLEVNINNMTETSVIEVYDTSGRLILHKEVVPVSKEYTEIINTSGFAKAAYILHVWSGRLSKTEKFVVE
ncbi:MAG: T9SS type A sorting domain-containing protein [Bacteroidales bacterium]|nr:T9SS type A sorting domain-containing protein [Bacteroidales bacterium]